MKGFMLYFLAIFILLSALPIAAKKSVASEEMPTITVDLGGETREITIEEYVLRVLAAENEKCENTETLKALSVAVRSCGMYFSLYGLKHESFHACGDGECCLPLGDPTKLNGETLTRCISAAEETEGQILTLDGLPAIALYTLCASNGTLQCEEFPYLTPVTESEKCETHKSERVYTLEELERVLPNNDIYNDSCLVYDENGKCEFGVIGGKLISGSELAKSVNLPSVEFTLELTESEACFVSYGAGHGYGLALCAADKKADGLIDYKKILEIYYPNLEINKIYYN